MLNTMKQKRRMSRRGIIAGAVGSAAAAGIGVLPARCSGNIYPGVSVNGIDVSGMTPEHGKDALRSALAGFESRAVTFVYDQRSWTASLADLGMAVDYQSVLRTAMGTVRDQGVVQRYSSLIQPDDRHEVPMFLREDPARLDSYLESIAAEIAVEPRDARLYKSGADVKVLEHRVGRVMDVDRARQAVVRQVRGGKPVTVEIEVKEVPPRVTASDLESAKTAARRLVSEPVVFTLGDAEYILDSDMLACALVIGPESAVSLDATRLDNRISAIEQDVGVAPQNVVLGWDNGVYVIEYDAPGRALDREKLLERLNAAAASDERVEPLPVVEVRAAARADNVDELGVEAHIGVGSSSFAGSSYERAVNVGAAAHNVNYKLIGPGEEFSFNYLLGPITEAYGYIAGSIIQGDFAATDIGGGVCQVSTTVFRAAQNAGFQFSEWNPHTWRLAFYEADGSSPGLDAAIYQPNHEWEYELDLRFVNPLDSWLLLMMVIDGDDVSAHFYGRDPGWTVEVLPARISDPKPIPGPVERVNEALAPGELRQVGVAEPGYTVWVRRMVTAADGTVLSDGEFVTDYLSKPETWEVGPS